MDSVRWCCAVAKQICVISPQCSTRCSNQLPVAGHFRSTCPGNSRVSRLSIRSLAVSILWLLVATFGHTMAVAEGPLVTTVAPADANFDEAKLAKIDELVAAALKNKQLPGCVVVIGRAGKVVLKKAYGNKRLQPTLEPMTTDTVFDLASLTKPIATATSAMILLDQKKIALDDPIAKYLPELAAKDDAPTIEHLLMHTAGYIADNNISDYQNGREVAIEKLIGQKLRTKPGMHFVYSDVCFMLLGLVVEKASGEPLDQFAKKNIFETLGMQETGYLPSDELKLRAAPTTMRDGAWIQGEVHDPRAHLLGGVAGHAGLFSTADDLAIYASAMLKHGTLGAASLMSDATWKEMLTPREVFSSSRGSERRAQTRCLGWDHASGFSSNAPSGRSGLAIGHGGFTGTAMWIDPELDLFVMFLSNRVHPDGSGSVNRLAGEIGTVAVEAMRK